MAVPLMPRRLNFFVCLSFISIVLPWGAAQSENGSALYKPLFEKHSKSTPKFLNVSGVEAHPLMQIHEPRSDRSTEKDFTSLVRRDLPVGVCAPGTPCSNGACCSKTGVCSYAKSSCAPENCISNCNATAPCGQYAKPENANCPLNVCCSAFGFCGSTDEFCTTSGPNPCQNGYGSCGDAPRPSCGGGVSTSGRTIGYYESWSSTRKCDTRKPEDLDLTSITHLNFAFAFFHPQTFQVTPMDPGDPELYRRFTALKTKKASLQTWISVGGWSFNDPTNVPNTRTAFSNMVASEGNRQKFISSLLEFMQTYNFDGVDLDWEYPAADDRGGVKSDTANLVTFLQELHSTFNGRYGISMTLPSSYWYLRGFDVKSMQSYVDWLNVMSYDIHGTWDSSNKFTGPYIRPHTNLTEIQEGLDLLWRAGVTPDKVTLGLGWYGRSFTLSNPSCNTPNGVCQFSAGANPGECTGTSGVLSNAEINRIKAKGGVQSSFDATAAVKWMTWDTNQWVSYDDGQTMQLKISAANKLCLGGIMIWAIDQDDTDSSSLDDLLGIGPANGVSAAEAAALKRQLNDATLASEIASSCYWTFCGESCTSGYFPATSSKGQIAGIQRETECSNDQAQTLCCAPGTTMGQCSWQGWRGVGLGCTPACNVTNATVVARNTNYFAQDKQADIFVDQSCNGGYQAYCCTGFRPSPQTNTGNLALVGQGGLTKRGELEARGRGRGTATGVGIGIPACAALVGTATIIADIFSFGLATLGAPAEYAACVAAAGAIGFIASGGGGGGTTQKPPPGLPPADHNTGTPPKPVKTYGQWQKLDFGHAEPGTTACDCQVTYTCRYGKGWDEVCDNQHWAIDKGLHHATVYHYKERGNSKSYSMTDWKKQHTSFQRLAQQSIGGVARCQVDEFPMGSLREALKPNPQICRLVNGPANGAQGRDFKAWKQAVWEPCSLYRKEICHSKSPEPPITWEIGAFPAGDNRARALQTSAHFLGAYGFDSQTPGSLCYATFEYTVNSTAMTSTVSDHGYRALNNDPMFTLAAYQWPLQNYKSNPSRANGVFPTDVASAQWAKRMAVQSALSGNLSEPLENCQSCDIVIDDDGEIIYLNEDVAEDLEADIRRTFKATATTTDAAAKPTHFGKTKAGAAIMRVQPVETARVLSK